MKQVSPSKGITRNASPHAVSDIHLHGYGLVLARIAWAVLLSLSLVIFFASFPSHFTELQTICEGASCAQGQPDHTTVQTLQTLGFSVSGYALSFTVISIVSVLVWFVVGGVIFWRKSNDWMALFVSFFLVAFAIGNYTSPTVLLSASATWNVPVELLLFISNISISLFIFLFPTGRFVPRWTGMLAGIWIVIQAYSAFFPRSPLDVSNYFLLDALLFLCLVALGLFAQIYRFRHVSNPIQRQQTKWVVFGIIVTGLGVIGLALPFLFFPLQTANGSFYDVMSTPVYGLVELCIPLSVGVAILRYRLWDIDIIINRTLVYGTLTALLALVYFGLVFALQFLLHGLISANNNMAIVISTLAIAALFQPLRSRIQRAIDRRFYRQKYDATHTLADFSAVLHTEVDLGQLSEHVVAVVQETMHPTFVSLWLVKPKKQALAPSPPFSSPNGTDR